MDRRELLNDPEEMLRAAFDGLLAGLWTALPGIVQSFDASKMTVVIQPAIRGRVRNPAGEWVSVNLPLLQDVPVVFPSGGGFTLTFPISAGDEALVIFADRCIDAWWQQGDVQPPIDLRIHDLSDGFAIVGPRSQPRVVPNVNTAAAQFRSDDGTVFVEVSDDQVHVSAPRVKVHAGTSYAWDVHGYGQRITWTGGSNYTVDNYTIGANVTTNNHAINPPEIP